MTDLEKELLDKIVSGNAILFTGAGFSADNTNIEGSNPPLGNKLAEKICEVAGITPVSESLDYVTDRCISEKHALELIANLKKWYELSSISDDTKSILSIKWRRLYTTNYDMGFELGLSANGKVHTSICADKDFSQKAKGENLCIHINGMIENLDENTLNKDFRLSSSSYVASALDEVTARKWKSFFKNDLENCSALIFIGYSLYDFEVEKLLYKNPDFKSKTYFIFLNDIFEPEKGELKYRLGKYGKILGIGKNGFAKLILSNLSDFSESELILTDFSQYDSSYRLDESEICDSNSINTLISGSQADKFASTSVYSTRSITTPLYFVYRNNSVESIIEKLDTGNHVFISAECGNGKTCLLYQVAAKLSLRSNRVYFLSKGYRGDREQLEYLAHLSGTKYIIVDNCFSNSDFLKMFLEAQYSNVLLICADRTARLEMLIKAFSDDDILAQNSVVLSEFDLFSKEETKAFLFLVSTLGQWGELEKLGISEKLKYLGSDNENLQLAPALLKLLNAQQIKDRISKLLSELLRDNDSYRKTIFALCYLSVIGIPLNDSTVSDVAGSDEIYKGDFFLKPAFKQLFVKSREGYTVTYSFAQYVLRESGYFTGNDIYEYLLDIVDRLGNKTVRGEILHKVVLDSLRFHSVESIVPEREKKTVMQSYYEKLKSIDVFGHRLMHDPHYWMQYAMTKMMCLDYATAQQYLDTAYGKASQLNGDSITGKYNTNKLDNQQSHLFLLMAKDKMTLDSGKIFELFEKADTKLRYAPVDRFLLHRLSDMIDVWKAKVTRLSNKHKVAIKETLIYYSKKILSAVNTGSCRDITQSMLNHMIEDFDLAVNYEGNEK